MGSGERGSPSGAARQAILQRLADDLAVLADDGPVPVARPAGDCCWLSFTVDGQPWCREYCDLARCDHVHHRFEVLYA